MHRLLDLFCGAGGAAMGDHRAGFDEIIGVDLAPQPRYPFWFIQADAILFLERYGREFDYIHASPPCQAFSCITPKAHRGKHENLIQKTRDGLEKAGAIYIIENVPGAPLFDPIMLCGSAFGLRVRRHRIFESNVLLRGKIYDHPWQDGDKIFEVFANGKRHRSGCCSVYGKAHGKADNLRARREAMGIAWMNMREISQAIPPAYTEYLGQQLLENRIMRQLRFF